MGILNGGSLGLFAANTSHRSSLVCTFCVFFFSVPYFLSFFLLILNIVRSWIEMYYFFLVNTFCTVQIISSLNGEHGATVDVFRLCIISLSHTFPLYYFVNSRAWVHPFFCAFFISDKSHRFACVYMLAHHNESTATWQNGDVLSMTILWHFSFSLACSHYFLQSNSVYIWSWRARERELGEKVHGCNRISSFRILRKSMSPLHVLMDALHETQELEEGRNRVRKRVNNWFDRIKIYCLMLYTRVA